MGKLPASVHIVEVGPRDGLQNEPEQIPTETKLVFIRALQAAGLPTIEAMSFVHPKAIPQLADSGDVAAALDPPANCEWMALVPNEKGLQRAIDSGIKRVAVFTAASDAFTQKNIRMTIAESLDTFATVVKHARAANMSVRGYVSTAFVCPYAGEIETQSVVNVASALWSMGCDEVAVSDTIGAAAPTDIQRVVEALTTVVPLDRIALHLHDTYGTALANVYAGLEAGVARFDASAGGLGGCPYAPGAAGNLATEDLVYLLDRMGIRTGVKLEKVFAASQLIAAALGRALPSKQWQRLRAACSG